jgi:hypothetical protein
MCVLKEIKINIKLNLRVLAEIDVRLVDLTYFIIENALSVSAEEDGKTRTIRISCFKLSFIPRDLSLSNVG